MKVLSIDLGSYSVKFYESNIDGKKINFLSKNEVIIDRIKDSLGTSGNLIENQIEIISQFLKGHEYAGKIIFQIPNDFLTTRVITIPVTNRKKTESMIPFQLEENIPYSLSKTHYTKTLNILDKTTMVSVYITNLDNFDKYFEFLKSKGTLPWILTCEMAIFESFSRRQKNTIANCILDLGHESTKAYFFDGVQAISNHFSHIAGKLIDETISQTYQISISDAVIYKHENCFFLLENQYGKVDKDQQEFALLMKHTFWPLILKIKQWMIGFKAISGKNIEKIFITGGTSKIKNIDNFLMEALGVPVEICNPYGQGNLKKFGLEEMDGINFSLPFLMTQAQAEKPLLPNFLSGDYSIAPKNRISIFNTAFLATRSVILLLILSLGFLFENFILKREEKNLETKLMTVFKSPALNIGAAERNNFRKSPLSVLKSFKKKSNDIEKEIKELQKIIQIDPIRSLKVLSSSITTLQDADLISYQFEGDSYTSVFKGKNPQVIKELNEKILSFGTTEKMIKINNATNELVFKYIYEE